MTIRTKLELAAGVALLVICGVVFRSWLGEHDARLIAEATTKAQQSELAKLDAADKQRAADTAATLAELRADVAKAKTPQQIATWLPQQVQTPQPITVNIPPATPQTPLPDAIAKVPQIDLPALRDYVEACKECQVKLAASQQDLESQKKKTELAEGEAQTWKVAAKGTVWSRTKTALKWLAIGAASGAVAVCGTGHCR